MTTAAAMTQAERIQLLRDQFAELATMTPEIPLPPDDANLLALGVVGPAGLVDIVVGYGTAAELERWTRLCGFAQELAEAGLGGTSDQAMPAVRVTDPGQAGSAGKGIVFARVLQNVVAIRSIPAPWNIG